MLWILNAIVFLPIAICMSASFLFILFRTLTPLLLFNDYCIKVFSMNFPPKFEEYTYLYEGKWIPIISLKSIISFLLSSYKQEDEFCFLFNQFFPKVNHETVCVTLPIYSFSSLLS